MIKHFGDFYNYSVNHNLKSSVSIPDCKYFCVKDSFIFGTVLGFRGLVIDLGYILMLGDGI